jgi:flavodoxin I
MEHAIGVAGPAKVLGKFSCFGQVNPEVLKKASAKTQPPDWIEDAANAIGHPNEGDLKGLSGAMRALKM